MYTRSNCSCILIAWIIVTWIFMYVSCILPEYSHNHFLYYCIEIKLLLSGYISIDIRCTELSVTWKPPLVSTGATFSITHLLFPVILFRDIKMAHVWLSCYMLHTLLLLLICIIHKCNMEMGET